MADWAKIALKTGLIVVITGLVITLFLNITVPNIDLTNFQQGVGTAKAILNYYYGTYYHQMLTLATIIFGIDFAIITVKLVNQGILFLKWVNE